MSLLLNIVVYGYGKFGKTIDFLTKDSQLNDNRNWSINYHQVNKGDSVAKCRLSGENNIIFLTTNSNEIPSIVDDLQEIKNLPCGLVLCSKGLPNHRNIGYYFWSDYIIDRLPNTNLFVLSGPNFADEIINKTPTYLNIGTFINCNKSYNSYFGTIRSLLYENKTAKIIPYTDLKTVNSGYAVQFMAAIKNIIAIEIGYQIGNTNNYNYVSYLAVDIFVQFCKDYFVSIIKKESIDFDVSEQSLQSMILSPSGIGDLILTCFTGKSRNYIFGRNLSDESYNLVEFLKNNTVEGIEAIKSLQVDGYDLSFLSCYKRIKQFL